MIDWDDAKIHIMSHVVHYGSSLFEGIRCYSTAQGPAVFRLREHIQRLHDSCKIYRTELEYSVDKLLEACLEVVRVNGFKECYLRPVVFRGYGPFGVYPLNNPVEVYIASFVWGKYLGQDSIDQGVDVCVSSWARMHNNTIPPTAKSAANYMNSQLIKMEAVANGFVEGIALDTDGNVSEGSGENLFLIRQGALYTPPLSSAVLPGILAIRSCRSRATWATKSANRSSRAPRSMSPTRSSSPAPPPRSRPSAALTAPRSATENAAPSPSNCKTNFTPSLPGRERSAGGLLPPRRLAMNK